MKIARSIIFSLLTLCFSISSMGAIGYEELCLSDSDFSLERTDDHHDDCHNHAEESTPCISEAIYHDHCLDLKLSDNDFWLTTKSLEKVKITNFITFPSAPISPVLECASGEDILHFSGVPPPYLSPHPFLTSVRLLI